MSINLSLVFLVLTLVAGVVWLIDALFFQKKREARQAAVTAQFSDRAHDDPAVQAQLQTALDKVREPSVVEYAKSFFPILVVVFVLRAFLYEPFQIPSGSMIPTLKIGDFILVNKHSYGVRNPVTNSVMIATGEPKRGDVAVFFPPHQPTTYYIKRVIGVPGDVISYNDHVLTVNGVEIEQTFVSQIPAVNPRLRVVGETLNGHHYLTHKHLVPGYLSRRNNVVVPEGHYFMMGDNRDESSDSRDWGMVSEEALVGRATVVWMHWKNFLSIPSFADVRKIQ